MDIRQIERVEKAAHYIGKYLTKNALTGMPDGIRRYGSSSTSTSTCEELARVAMTVSGLS